MIPLRSHSFLNRRSASSIDSFSLTLITTKLDTPPSSARRPSELSSTDHVIMQMPHRLPRIPAVVHNQAKPHLIHFFLLGHGLYGKVYIRNQRPVLFFKR